MWVFVGVALSLGSTPNESDFWYEHYKGEMWMDLLAVMNGVWQYMKDYENFIVGVS